MKPFAIALLIFSQSSYAGTATCYIGTANIVDSAVKKEVRTGTVEVIELAPGFGPLESDPKVYQMHINRKYVVRFQLRKGQAAKKNSTIRFSCTQIFTERGPSDRNCLLLSESEYNLDEQSKLKFCSIPFLE